MAISYSEYKKRIKEKFDNSAEHNPRKTLNQRYNAIARGSYYDIDDNAMSSALNKYNTYYDAIGTMSNYSGKAINAALEQATSDMNTYKNKIIDYANQNDIEISSNNKNLEKSQIEYNKETLDTLYKDKYNSYKDLKEPLRITDVADKATEEYTKNKEKFEKTIKNTEEYQKYDEYAYNAVPILDQAKKINEINQEGVSTADKIFVPIAAGAKNSLRNIFMPSSGDYRLANGNLVNLPTQSDIKAEQVLNNYDTGIGEFLGKASYSIGQQLPSMAIGAVTGGLGTAAGASTSAINAARTAGSLSSMFANVSRSTTNQKLMEGYTKEQANQYGLMSGAIEVATETAFGGFAKLMGPGWADNFVTNRLTQNIQNRVLRNLADAGISSVGEGVEEVVSGLLQPIAQQIALDDPRKYSEILSDQNLLEDFMVGTISSLIMSAPSTVVSFANNNQTTNQSNNSSQINLPPVNLQESIVNDAVNSRIEQNSINVPIINRNQNINSYQNINEAMYEYANNIKDNFETNINIKTSKSTVPVDYSTQSQTSIFNKAKSVFSKIGKNVFKNNGENIYVSNSDIKESIAKTIRNTNQKKLLAEHIEVFEKLDKIIENGQIIARGSEMKGRSQYKNWDYYATPITINGENYIVEFDTVLRDNGQKHFRLERIYSLNEATQKQVAPTGKIENQSVNRFVEQPVSINNNSTNLTQSQIAPLPLNNMQNNNNNIQNINLPNFNRVMNPVEILRLTPEDANTSPVLPKDPTRESSYEDASLEEIAQILDEKPVTEKQKDNRAKVFLVNKFLDKGYYVDKLARQYKNRELSAKYDYSLLHNGIANEIIGNGRYDSEGNKIGKSLYEIFAPIEESNLTREFSEYLYHLHNIDRMSLNQTHNEDNKPVFGNSVTAERSQEIVNELLKKYPEFEAYAQDIYDYNNANLQMLVDNGVISKEDMDYYNKKYPHYVPIIRNNTNTRNQMIYLAGKAATVGVPIKKAKGGNSDIIPLKEAMAMRTMQTVNSALKNDFGLELLHTVYGENANEVVETAQSLDETIDEMDSTKIVEPKTSDREATFTVYQNGKKITMEISDEIYEALTPRKTGTIKPLHAFNNLRRAVLTEYNPAFVISNILKDVQDGSYNSKHPALFLKNIPEATSQLKNKGKLYQLYIANGGGQDTYFNYDSGTNVKSKRKYVPTGNKLLDTIKLPLKILDKISDINQAVEMTPRLAEFIASLEAGDSIQTAMYNAQEITTNFKRGGDFTKTLDKNGVTFLNAGTQGFLKQIRNVQDAKVNGLRGIANLGVRALLFGTKWILLNDLIWGDDEDYEELSDYVKNNYYIIGKYGDGNFIRVPKGRVVSIIQKAFEEVWDGLTGEDVDLDQLADLVQNQVLPSDPTENNIFSPLVQAFGSENGEAWYGGDLVPSRLQDLPAAEQYDESTDSFSIWLGNLLNVSPYKINYVLDQYSGVIGDLTLPYLTKEAETSGIIAPLKDKFTTNSTLNNQNASDFYDLKDELQKQSNSSKATDEDKLKYKYINYINSQTSELYKQKREVQNSSLSDKDKMSKIEEIQSQINDLTRNGIESYENVETFENYGKVADVEFYLNSENEWERVKEEEQTELEELGLTSEGKNTYFKAKVESGIIRNDDSKNNTVKHQEISNVILNTGFDDEKIAYLYSRYYSSEETLNNLIEMRIPIKEFIKFDSQEFEGDYNTRTGKTISGSRKNKVIQYVKSLNLSIPQKAILIKMEYNSYDNYNEQIVNYIKQNVSSVEERSAILTELGFTIRNGRVYW